METEGFVKLTHQVGGDAPRTREPPWCSTADREGKPSAAA